MSNQYEPVFYRMVEPGIVEIYRESGAGGVQRFDRRTLNMVIEGLEGPLGAIMASEESREEGLKVLRGALAYLEEHDGH